MHPGFKFAPLTFVRSIYALILADILEDLRRKIRPYELNTGETDTVFDRAINSLLQSLEAKGMAGAFKSYKDSVAEMVKIPYNREQPRPLVFVIGEYIANFHPDCNFYIEDYLEKNGMEVQFPRMYDVFRKYLLHTVSDVRDFKVRHSLADKITAFGGNVFFDLVLDKAEPIALPHPLYTKAARLPAVARRSDAIMHHSINSGESFLIPAEILHNAEHGIRSFVILQPFGCLPNHICGRGIVKRLKEEYPAIQILPIDYDPDTSFANVENRLQMLIMNAKGF
jgi:predicted nucleotide-binding protein (sugar kinase/HSP70/actin superfamily)